MSEDDLSPRLAVEQGQEPRAGVLTSDFNGVSSDLPLPSPHPWERYPEAISRPADAPPVPMVELSKSDRQFIAAYAAGGGLAEVGRRWQELRGGRPYKTTDAASHSASRKLCEIRRRLAEGGHPELFWEWMGLSASRIAETLAAGMLAVRREPVSVRRDKVVMADGREKIVRDDTVEIVEVGEDHRSRIESAVRSASLRGELYASRRNEVSAEEAGRPQINIVIRSFAGIVNNSLVSNPPQPALSAENLKEE